MSFDLSDACVVCLALFRSIISVIEHLPWTKHYARPWPSFEKQSIFLPLVGKNGPGEPPSHAYIHGSEAKGEMIVWPGQITQAARGAAEVHAQQGQASVIINCKG